MSSLIDTNALSEFGKKRQNQKVIDYVNALPQESIFVSVLSLGEIIKGIQKTSDQLKRKGLLSFYELTLERFKSRIIDVDLDIATRWGRLLAEHKRTLPVADSLLAATCLSRNLTLITRNTKDFEDIAGLTIINPWD